MARIVLIGAGSLQFGLGTMGDIFQSEVLAGSEVVLHDINPTALARVEAAGQAFVAEHNLPFTLSATLERPVALQGADFIISSIEVGDRFALWEQDWRIPQQYGIRQVYGENGGPGGLFHSLRITPPILEIVGDAMRICPEAVIFNYSNPMSRICTTVHRRYPQARFIGMCHEIASLQRHLPLLADTPWENLDTRAGGLNHFSVLLEATYRDTGRDAYPDILAKAPAYFEQLPSLGAMLKYAKETGATSEDQAADAPAETYESWPERRLFRAIVEDFGLLPITTDSHLGEYVQWAWDAVDHKGILDFYTFYKGFLAHREPKIELKLTERVIPIIEGILTDAGYEEGAVNLPNAGLIPDLPDWLVVEVPGIVGAYGVRGVHLPDYPRGFLGLLQNQVAVHDMTAEAILTGSRAAVVQALLVDPVVDVYAPVRDLVDTMLEAQADYLGYIS